MQFSIIMPVLNEAVTLTDTLTNLLGTINNRTQVEIILSDGGSQDDSMQLAKRHPVITINSQKGRALQMNAGAQQARGEWLVFLHADTQLPPGWMQLIEHSTRNWGRFDVRLGGKHWLLRVIEKAMNIRSCKTSVATGDQALFFRRDFFVKLGGFPEIPLMEDIAICKRARKLAPPACIQQPVITSSRRWEQKGIVRTMMLMWALRLAYWLGVKPATLHRLYYAKN